MGEISNMTVFVTGAGGFIGRRVVANLLADEVKVVALARSRAAVRGLEQAGAQVVRANLNNPAGLAEVLNGCDGVAHLAYDMRASGQENLRAFETLLTA